MNPVKRFWRYLIDRPLTSLISRFLSNRSWAPPSRGSASANESTSKRWKQANSGPSAYCWNSQSAQRQSFGVDVSRSMG